MASSAYGASRRRDTATATPPVYTETTPTVTAITPLLYRVEEAAEALRISRTQIYALIRCGELRTVKIGGSRRVPVTACTEYVENLEVAA